MFKQNICIVDKNYQKYFEKGIKWIAICILTWLCFFHWSAQTPGLRTRGGCSAVVGWSACLYVMQSFFMRHTSKRAVPGHGTLLVSQDSLQLRAQHNDRECQQLNRPNLSIFSKTLAAKTTLPPTHSSQWLQTIILFLPAAYGYSRSTTLSWPQKPLFIISLICWKGYWLPRPFGGHQVIYHLEAMIANQSRRRLTTAQRPLGWSVMCMIYTFIFSPSRMNGISEVFFFFWENQ